KTFSITNLVIELVPFESIYINPTIMGKFEEKLKLKTSSRFLNSAIIDLLSDRSEFSISEKLEPKLLEILKRWKENFFSSCSCEENPYCEHGVIIIGRRILDLRKKGNDPKNISSYFEKKYALQIYRGDVLNWLEMVVFKLEGISRIAEIVFPVSGSGVKKLRAALVHGKKDDESTEYEQDGNQTPDFS
ncbi:MAG: DUF5814 domain-containing protein, partial [Candidatus Odinarchaeota archaeon]